MMATITRGDKLVQIRITGHYTFKAGTRRARKIFYQRAAQLVRAEGREVLKRARFYCPVDTGRLQGTGRLRGPRQAEMNAGRFTVEVVFGGARAPYAIQVHEDLTVRHMAPTRSKYLWQALLDRQRVIQVKAARQFRGALG